MKEMNDLISRQTVLALPRNITRNMMGKIVEESIDVELIKALLPVQPKHGRWIERNPLSSDKCRLIECDQCGNSYIVGFNVPYEHWIDNRNYCEKCGADMRGETE